MSATITCPLMFTPLLKVRVWGGETLKSRAPGAPDEPIGESWEIADHGEDTVRVGGGPFAGRSLHELLQEDRAALAGEALDPANPDVFPLMLKLIDPRDVLSVQVHPDDVYANRQKPGELGKTEAWYVLGADPGGRIYRGLKPGVTREDLQQALAQGTVADLLDSFEAKAGDVVNIPSGTIHALGAGVRIAEIQQNSDTTYRVFDWNRTGLDGKPRELHVEHALAVTNFGDQGGMTCSPEMVDHPGCLRERFIRSEKFNLERLSAFRGRPVRLDTEGRRFHILTALNGSVEVRCEGGAVTACHLDTVLVPAGAGEYALHPSPDAAALLMYRE